MNSPIEYYVLLHDGKVQWHRSDDKIHHGIMFCDSHEIATRLANPPGGGRLSVSCAGVANSDGFRRMLRASLRTGATCAWRMSSDRLWCFPMELSGVTEVGFAIAVSVAHAEILAERGEVDDECFSAAVRRAERMALASAFSAVAWLPTLASDSTNGEGSP